MLNAKIDDVSIPIYFKADSILNRIHVAEPQARDKKARPAFIPASVFEKRAKKKDGMDTDDEEDEEDMVLEFGPGMDAPKMPKKSKYQIKTERDIELELGDDYILDLQKNYDIAEEEKYDVIPETWNGHNIADYVDPDIMKKLEALEKEEELREQAGFYNSEESEEEENIKEIRQLASKIRVKKKLMKNDQKMNNTKVSNLCCQIDTLSILTNFIYLIQTQISCSVTETSSTQNNYRQESGEKC